MKCVIIKARKRKGFFMIYNSYFKDADDNATLEEKIELIKQNNKSASLLRNEINARGGGVVLDISSPTSSTQNSARNEANKRECLEEDFIHLYNQISLLDLNDFTGEDTFYQLRKMLGNVDPFIIDEIKLMLYKESILYGKMLLNSTDFGEIQELERSIKSITAKLELFDELEEEKEEEDIPLESTQNNNLFFLESASGKVIALESLRKNIPCEYYPVFKELLLGLKEGKLSGIKKLHRLDFLQIKDFKVRIIFDKLSNGNYIILDCFIKKVYSNSSYRNNLINRKKEYQKRKSYYFANYPKPEFILEHQSYLAEILSLLDSRTLEGRDFRDATDNERRTI